MRFLNKVLTSFVLLLITGGAHQVQASYCFLDNYSYCWELSLVSSDATANYYSGTMRNFSGGPFGAAATELKPNNGGVSISSDFGTSFHYDLQWALFGGRGAWANSSGFGRGNVTSFVPIPCPCSSIRIDSKDYSGIPRPGE